jgi:hypothetical protein
MAEITLETVHVPGTHIIENNGVRLVVMESVYLEGSKTAPCFAFIMVMGMTQASSCARMGNLPRRAGVALPDYCCC